MIVLIFILSLMTHNGFGCELTVLWQSNPCVSDLKAMPKSTHLPLSNEGCEFGTKSSITFINEDRNRIENVNQVKSQQAMLDCNAANRVNPQPVIVNETAEIQFEGNSFFQFSSREVYLISTSNGTIESAKYDTTGPRNCLAMYFRVVPHTSNCDTCAPFQLENLITNCTNATTPTSTTGDNMLPTSTKMDYTRPNFTNSISVSFNCGTECVLIILVSLLLFLIGSVCCICVLVRAIPYLNRRLNRKRFWKRFKKQIKYPERDPTNYQEKDPKYFLKKIDRTVECRNPQRLDKTLSEKENSDKIDKKSPSPSQILGIILSEKENSPKIDKKRPSPSQCSNV